MTIFHNEIFEPLEEYEDRIVLKKNKSHGFKEGAIKKTL